jgi:hypothetical protein
MQRPHNSLLRPCDTPHLYSDGAPPRRRAARTPAPTSPHRPMAGGPPRAGGFPTQTRRGVCASSRLILALRLRTYPRSSRSRGSARSSGTVSGPPRRGFCPAGRAAPHARAGLQVELGGQLRRGEGRPLFLFRGRPPRAGPGSRPEPPLRPGVGASGPPRSYATSRCRALRPWPTSGPPAPAHKPRSNAGGYVASCKSRRSSCRRGRCPATPPRASAAGRRRARAWRRFLCTSPSTGRRGRGRGPPGRGRFHV